MRQKNVRMQSDKSDVVLYNVENKQTIGRTFGWLDKGGTYKLVWLKNKELRFLKMEEAEA